MEVGPGHWKGLAFKCNLQILPSNVVFFHVQVVYFTATVPYLLLFIFLGRGVTLPGAGEGLRFLFEPRWERMLDAQVLITLLIMILKFLHMMSSRFGSMLLLRSSTQLALLLDL